MADKKISALTGASTPLAGTEVLPIVQSGTTVKVSAANVTAGRAVSALTYESTATTGTAPFTVASTTQVANLNAATAGTALNLKSNATTGVVQIIGPAAASTRVITVPDANFTVARTDAAQTFIGDQTLSTGNLVQGTAGKGINFTANTPAAGKTSQLLNWYEEGTWTPTFHGYISNPTCTYTVQVGRYTRIGNLVSVQGRLSVSAFSGGSSAISIAGLPFTPANVGNLKSAGSVGYNSGFTKVPNTLYIDENTATLGLWSFTGGYIDATEVTASADIFFQCTYQV